MLNNSFCTRKNSVLVAKIPLLLCTFNTSPTLWTAIYTLDIAKWLAQQVFQQHVERSVELSQQAARGRVQFVAGMDVLIPGLVAVRVQDAAQFRQTQEPGIDNHDSKRHVNKVRLSQQYKHNT